MFEFLKLIPGETKKEYKRRVEKRGTEIINGENCTIFERVDLMALQRCKATLIRVNGKTIGGIGISKEEIALRAGNAKSYEEYVNAVFLKHLDQKMFEEEKAKIWEELRDQYIKSELSRNDETYSDVLFQEKLDEDEQYEYVGQGLAYSKRFRIGKR